MFYGEGGSGSGYGKNDIQEIKKTVEQIAATQYHAEQGKADYPTFEASNSGGPADPNKDLWFLNRSKGEEYGSSDPTGDEKKQQIDDTEKTKEAIYDIREQIKKMANSTENKKVEHEKAEEDFFDIAA